MDIVFFTLLQTALSVYLCSLRVNIYLQQITPGFHAKALFSGVISLTLKVNPNTMKTRGRYLNLLILLFVTAGASAQCGSQLSTVSYDTTVTGSGNDFFNFTFPKFDPVTGTLTEVNVDATVTLVYGFQLENNGAGAVNNYRVRLTRNDDVSSNVLLTPLSNEQQNNYGPFSMTATDNVAGAGPDFITRGPLYAMNQQEIKNTVYNTADFMGGGQISFDYASTSFASLIGSASVSYTGNVQDEVTFKITYNYCPAAVLASDITSFTTGSLTDGTIDIKWITKNEKTNRKYELQKSTDGRVFRGVTEFAAQTGSTETGTYRHSYKVQPDENNKILYFRIKLVDEGGSPKFSATRAVKLTSAASTQPILYPNPAKGTTTLQFNNKNQGNWEVEILTISGQVVQRYFFNNALLAKLNTANDLHRGLYMVRSTNKTTQEQFVQRLLIQ